MIEYQLIKNSSLDKIVTILDIQTQRIIELEGSVNRLRDELYGLKDRLYDEKIL